MVSQTWLLQMRCGYARCRGLTESLLKCPNFKSGRNMFSGKLTNGKTLCKIGQSSPTRVVFDCYVSLVLAAWNWMVYTQLAKLCGSVNVEILSYCANCLYRPTKNQEKTITFSECVCQDLVHVIATGRQIEKYDQLQLFYLFFGITRYIIIPNKDQYLFI